MGECIPYHDIRMGTKCVRGAKIDGAGVQRLEKEASDEEEMEMRLDQVGSVTHMTQLCRWIPSVVLESGEKCLSGTWTSQWQVAKYHGKDGGRLPQGCRKLGAELKSWEFLVKHHKT
jgi:hypothetical protein